MNNGHRVAIARPVKTAVVGVGGFANVHHTAVLHLESRGMIKMIATCDPRVEELEDVRCRHRFKERGVEVYRDLESLLRVHGACLDMVVVEASDLPEISSNHDVGCRVSIFCEGP